MLYFLYKVVVKLVELVLVLAVVENLSFSHTKFHLTLSHLNEEVVGMKFHVEQAQFVDFVLVF